MSKNTFYPTVFMTVALLVFALLAVPRAFAVTFTVNSTDDLPDDLTIPGTCHTAANTCTLRAAVMQANRTSGLGATVIVPAGIYTLTIPAAGANGDESGDLNLTSPTIGSPVITIIGAGASTTIINANQLDRVFHIGAGRTASITGVTILNGYSISDGGGIFSDGTLTVTNSTISGNQARIGGGGIFSNNGPLTVTNSTISGNQARGLGGGISNYDGSLNVSNSTIYGNSANNGGGGIYNLIGVGASTTMNVSNSTISQNTTIATLGALGGGILNTFGSLNVSNSTIYGNSAYNGGGIVNNGDSSLNVSNSTISGNQAGGLGGGIFNYGTLTVTNSTISLNNANNNGGGIYNYYNANVYNTSIVYNGADADHSNGGSGGGVYNELQATFNLRNALVAGNFVSAQSYVIYDQCTGTLNSFGRNLFGEDTFCTVNNGVGGSWGYLNSLNTLGPLQNNGGPTWTHALLPGSNAIDGGDPVQGCIGPDALPLATDQRGAARVVGVRCDIGAFEYGAKVPWLYLPMIIRN
jgi:hypothetical protein